MISKEFVKGIARLVYPNQLIKRIEPYFATNMGSGVDDVAALTDIATGGDPNTFYCGVVTYFDTFSYYPTFDNYEHGSGVTLHPVPGSGGNATVSPPLVLAAIDAVSSLGWEFVGYRVTLQNLGFFSGTISVPSSTDRNIESVLLNGKPLSCETGANVNSSPITHGQSGEYETSSYGGLLELVCNAGIKAASFRVTTSQGVQELPITANGDSIEFTVRLNSFHFRIEIIDLTA